MGLCGSQGSYEPMEQAQEKILPRDSENRSLMMTLHLAVWKVWTEVLQEHEYPLLGGPGLWEFTKEFQQLTQNPRRQFKEGSLIFQLLE